MEYSVYNLLKLPLLLFTVSISFHTFTQGVSLSKFGDYCTSNATCGLTNGSYCKFTSPENGTCACVFMYAPNSIKECEKVHMPGNLTVDILNGTSATYRWTAPTPYPGQTNYSLKVLSMRDIFHPIRRYFIQGYNNTSIFVTNLKPFDEEEVQIAVSAEQFSYTPGFGTGTYYNTPAAAPGPIALLVRHSLEAYSILRLSWEIADKNGCIDYFILAYQRHGHEEVTLNKSANARQIGPRTCSYSGWFQNIKVVTNSSYIFKIYAVNTIGDISPTAMSQMYIPDIAPERPYGQYIFQAESPSDTRVYIRFLTDFFQNADNGEIIEYGLLVMNTFKDHQDPLPPGKKTAAEYRTYPNWFQVGNGAVFTPYRATSLNWDILKDLNGTSANVTFTVGAAGNCDGKPTNSFCNGQLVKNTFFEVKAFACTSGGCTESQPSQSFLTTGVPPVWSVGLICSVAIPSGIVLICVAALIVIKARSRQKNPTRSMSESGLDSQLNRRSSSLEMVGDIGSELW